MRIKEKMKKLQKKEERLGYFESLNAISGSISPEVLYRNEKKQPKWK